MSDEMNCEPGTMREAAAAIYDGANGGEHAPTCPNCWAWQCLREGAEEIARLRAENAALAAAMEKCREALESATTYCGHDERCRAIRRGPCDCGYADNVVDPAKAALALDPLCAAALARVVATDAVVVAAREHAVYAKCTGCGICSAVASLLDSIDKEQPHD